jgi:uncharacterized protein YndB with AHSA1/START domain
MELSREITLPAPVDEVWRSLAEPEWLGEDARIELRPDGEVRAGDRTGFVEEVEEESRLVFWWSEAGEESSRVELELTEDGEETHLHVVESRPLSLLDVYGPEVVFEVSPQRFDAPQQPELLAH